MRDPFSAARRRKARRRRLWSLAVLVVLLGIAWWRFGYALVSSQVEERLAAAPAGTTFSFADVAAPAWDRMVLLGPYTDRASAERAIGSSWPEYGYFGLDASDTFSLVVLLRGGNIAAVEKVPRCNPDFDRAALGRPYAPDARFRVVLRGTCKVLLPLSEAVPAA